MEFENGRPKKEVDDIHFSIFSAINHLAAYTHVRTEYLLRKIESIHRIIVSLISSILLSGLILSAGFNKYPIMSFITSYIFSYLTTLFIEWTTKRIYKPSFYDQSSMKLADVVNKLSGPNKDWDIVTTDEFKLRREIEYHTAYLGLSTFTIFGLMIVYAVISSGISDSITLVDSEILRNGFSAGFFYLLLIIAFIHVSFSLSRKKSDLLIYGTLMVLSIFALIYFISITYFQLYFGG